VNTSLSVCVITKNESKFIEACLASVQSIAHEIIVVDSGSTDDTLSIAARFNARIFSIEWRNDYAWARNQAIAQCQGDWILFLDADEYLQHPAQLARILRQNRNKKVGGYLIERTDIYRHKENGLIIHYPVGLVRLFSNLRGYAYMGSVHEQINTSITDKGHQIGIVKKASIVHQVHMSSDDFLQSKQERYLQLINKELEKDPTNYWMLYQKAKTHWFLQEREMALQLFANLASDAACPLVLRCSGFCNQAVLLMEAGQLEAAIASVQKSLALNPQQSLGMMVLGNILYKADRYKESIKAFKQVKTSINKLRYNQIIPGDLYVRPAEKRYKIACNYLAMGKTAAAVFLLKRALKRDSNHAPSLLLLGRIYNQLGQSAKAQHYVAACLSVNPDWTEAVALGRELGIGN
jgi:glycosyltransferase involved in cell wall biosynthesis